jgi:hypothetical protein
MSARRDHLPNDVVELEERSTSATAYEHLLDYWRRGERGREVALHLLFLAWDQLMEPPHLTGRSAATSDDELLAVFNAAHAAALPDGDRSTDVEALYVVGLIANLAPWLLGPNEEWQARSDAYRRRYREVLGGGITPAVFRDARGSYAEYFRGQAGVVNGY